MNVVRNYAAKEATPYLRKWLPVMLADGMDGAHTLAMDIGCGQGRNAEFLTQHGICTLALDQRPDYKFAMKWDAKNRLPASDNSIGLILLQYVWMFLNPFEKSNLCYQIQRVAKPTCVIVFELEDVKSGSKTSVSNFIEELTCAGPGWRTIHREKKRCILQLPKGCTK